MRGNAVQSNAMAKKNSLKNKDEKPMSFKQAITGILEMPYLTHKQIDELRKKQKQHDIKGKK